MANIQAFRGLRYDLAQVGSLSSVVAPPYDVIDHNRQQRLYQRNEHNVVRLILNRGDDLIGEQTIYDRAAELLKSWRREGILKAENEGVIYVYHQTFTIEGQTFSRRGFMARVRLEPFGTGNIFPHEQTHTKAKEDRFKLMSACRANLSPIFGIFPDSNNQAQTILEAAIDDQTPLQATDEDHVEHKLWLVNDPAAIAAVAELMGPKPVYIADGHHRYETACNVQTSCRENGEINVAVGEHPIDYVLMMCVSMHDSGMVILPTHRLFRDFQPVTSAQFIERLGDAFHCEIIGQGADFAVDIWELIQLEESQSTMGFFCRSDNGWVLARLSDSGEQQMREVSVGKSKEWCGLGVSILHELVIKRLLGCTSQPTPKYVHSIGEVTEALKSADDTGRDASGQDGTGDPFELACLVMPATVSHVKAISELDERMPAKSTYFYPKLLSGLVINRLD